MKKILMSAAILVLAAPVFAQSTQAPAQRVAPTQMLAFTDPANVPADLARIDYAMNATKSFAGRFVQYAQDGSSQSGNVYLKRPQNLRFEYDAPSTFLIVADRGMFVQHDTALETYDRVPLSATPLSYFLKENLNLAEDTEVVALQKSATEWRVTARDGSGQMEGAITMVFNAQNLALKEWIISDDFGGQTRVVLSDLQYNGVLDPRLFILRDDSNRRDR